MAQALGLFDTASGQVAGTLGVVDFGPECFSGHPRRSLRFASRSESSPSTIWIAAGVDAEDGTPGAGGTMPDARVYSQWGDLLGESIHNDGLSAGDTNNMVVPQADSNEGRYTLFSGNHGSGNSLDNSICIAWASIHWPSQGPRYAWSGGWGRACEKWGAQWYYSGTTVPGSDDYTPDCLWVYNWDPKRFEPYPPGTNETHPPVQGFHVNWHDMKIEDYDRRINTSAQAMCDTRSFRLYKNHDPQQLVLRAGEIQNQPSIVPTSHYTTTEKTTSEPSTTEQPTTEPTTEPTIEPTTKPTKEPTEEPTAEPTTTDPEDSSSTEAPTPPSVTTIPESSTTTETFITTTMTVKPPAKVNKRQEAGAKQDEHQQHRQQKQAQDPSQPAPNVRRGSSIPEKFANVLVINDHAHQTAEGLCESHGSLGPSFADARARMYCDMETKTLYPFCEDSGYRGNTMIGRPAGEQGEDIKVCFDFEGSKMLRGPGVQKRQAPRVQDWRVRPRQGGR